MSTFVVFGNDKHQFTRLRDLIVQNLDLLPSPVVVQHGFTDFISKNIILKDFFSDDEFNANLDQSSLIISHGGAGVPLWSLKNKTCVILVPRLASYKEHINNHQLESSESFSKNSIFIDVLQDVNDRSSFKALISRQLDINLNTSEVVKKNTHKFYELQDIVDKLDRDLTSG